VGRGVFTAIVNAAIHTLKHAFEDPVLDEMQRKSRVTFGTYIARHRLLSHKFGNAMHCPLCATETHARVSAIFRGQVAIFGGLTSVTEFALLDGTLGRIPGFEKKRWYGAHGS
jgi:hypothetical protein